VSAFYLKGTPPKRCFELRFEVEKYKQKSPIEVGFILDGIGNFRVEWREV